MRPTPEVLGLAPYAAFKTGVRHGCYFDACLLSLVGLVAGVGILLDRRKAG